MLHSTVSRWSLNMKISQSPCTTADEPQSPSHKVMVSLQPLCFSLCTLTLILSLDATKRSLALFLHPPFTYFYTLMRSPRAISSLGLAFPAYEVISYGSSLMLFLNHAHSPSLDSFLYVHASLTLKRPELDSIVQWWPSQC